MSENGQKRFELIELVSPAELRTQILAFAKITGIAAGVVRQPGEGEDLLPSASDLQDWRLTPVMYFDKHGSLRETGSKLCELIRTLDSGSKACMRSDFAFAHEAFTAKQPVGYVCETAHLQEYIAAISVGGHHLANVYLGQVRLKTSDPEAAWNEFKKLQGLASNATAVAHVTKEKFIGLFDELPEEASVPEEGTIKTALAALASLISSRASRQGALKVVEEITSEVGASTTIREGLEVFWRKIGRILHFSSGGLYLIEGEWLVPSVSSYPKMLAQDMRIHIHSKEGIVPWVAQKGEAVRFDSRAEMDEKLPPAVSRSRDERKINSLIACPLRIGDGSIVGVLEVGSEENRIFTEDDEGLLITLANFAAAFVKSARRQNFLQRINQETNIEKLLEFLVLNMPDCIGGVGCSVFLRDYGSWDAQRAVLQGGKADTVVQEVTQQDAWLRATSEFKASACGKLSYKSGEGLTGWVLKHKRPLRIPAGKDARSPSNLRAFADSEAGVETPIWEGKLPDEGALRPKAYFKDLGYLAVPIVGSQDVCWGVIRIGETRRTFTEADENTLYACAAAIAKAIESFSVVRSLRMIYRTDIRIDRICKAVSRQTDEILSFWSRVYGWALIPFGAAMILFGGLGAVLSDSMRTACLVIAALGVIPILEALLIIKFVKRPEIKLKLPKDSATSTEV